MGLRTLAIEILALSIEVLQRSFGNIASDWCFALTIDDLSEATEIFITYDLLPALTIEINTNDFYFRHKRLSILPAFIVIRKPSVWFKLSALKYSLRVTDRATGNPNTLSAIKINVLLFTCVLLSILSRLKGIWMNRRRFRVTSLTIYSRR